MLVWISLMHLSSRDRAEEDYDDSQVIESRIASSVFRGVFCLNNPLLVVFFLTRCLFYLRRINPSLHGRNMFVLSSVQIIAYFS